MNLKLWTATAIFAALSTPAHAGTGCDAGGSISTEYNYLPTGEILSEEPTLELWYSWPLSKEVSATVTAFSEFSAVLKDPWQSEGAEIDFEIEGAFDGFDLGIGYYYYPEAGDGDLWVYGGLALPLGLQFEAQRLEGYTDATSFGLSRPFEVAKLQVTSGFWHAEFNDYTSQTAFLQAELPVNDWFRIRLLGSSTDRAFEDKRDDRLTISIVVGRNE